MIREAAIRVLIVDDSAVVRGVLGRVVDAEPDMRVVTTATNGRDALDALRQSGIDVVLLDIEMPIMDGITALPLIAERHPDVRVLVTSSLTHHSATITMRALALGAVDYVHKPSARQGGVYGVEAAASEIVAKIRAVARADVKRAVPQSETATPCDQPPVTAGTHSGEQPPRPTRAHQVNAHEFEPQVLVMAASTGGPNALAAVIAGLPGDFPLPVLVTQHMPPIFTTMFAQRLAREGKLPCDEARDGEVLQAGRVYVAPGDHHLTVRAVGATRTPTIHVNQEPHEHHCRPAADPMFRSAAQLFSGGVLAVVLTGMGEDGRQGAAAVVEAGGRVLVQDAATSVVWGMPGSIVAAGVPCTVLPLHAIAQHVASLCSVRS